MNHYDRPTSLCWLPSSSAGATFRKSKESILLPLEHPTTFRFFFVFCRLREISSKLRSFQFLTQHFSGFLSTFWVDAGFSALPSRPPSASTLDPANSGSSCCRGRRGNSWMASHGGQEASLTENRNEERISAVSFLSRVAQLRKKLVSSSRPSTLAIQPSKNGFCHTSRTSNGINVGVSAQRRLIAWRASQHANVMHG